IVIDADDRGAAALDARREALLDRRVVLDRAVPVEMIGADIEQDADRRIERRREVDLVGRALDYVRMPAARRLEREDRGADIAAALGLMAGARQDVGEECRGGGLAVGAGDRNERGVRRAGAAL